MEPRRRGRRNFIAWACSLLLFACGATQNPAGPGVGVATYYVDLSSNTNAGSAGTTADPYGRDEFQTAFNNNAIDTYYMRGGNVLTANLGGIGVHTVYAWDAGEPWRLYGGKTYHIDTQSHIYDGVLECNYIDNNVAGVNFERCYLRAHTDVPGSFPVSALVCGQITDCTVVTNGTARFNGSFTANRNIIIFLGASNRVVATTLSAVTITNGVTNNSSWSTFVGSYNITDGGGNLYGLDFTDILSAWDNPDLQAFNLYPTRGVGSPGAWAEITATTSVLSGKAPLVVTFDHTATDYFKTTWSFGDGTTSNDKLFQKRYISPGKYTPTLTLTNETAGAITAATI